MPESHDPRLTPARADVAAAHLRGQVEAARFTEGITHRVIRPRAPVTARPDADASLSTELLSGEGFTVYDAAEGWAWGQADGDGYVGFVPTSALGPDDTPATHRVSVPATHIYPAPDLKTRPRERLPMGAQVTVPVSDKQAGFVCLTNEAGWIYARHLVPIGQQWGQPLDVAMGFLGAPYLWGGRTADGIDCSGLVQMALMAAGIACPRDTDMQAAALAERLSADARVQAGDLVYFPGHVGFMVDETHMLHANATHMAVTINPLTDVVDSVRRDLAARRVDRPPVTCVIRLTP
ncbi:MAG: C40 family peptidase [Sphingomonadales bacterium]